MRALIRRYQGHSDNLLQQGDLTLNLSSQQVLLENLPLEITQRVRPAHPPADARGAKCASRNAAAGSHSWNDDPGSNTLEVHIHNLRRKLGKRSHQNRARRWLPAGTARMSSMRQRLLIMLALILLTCRDERHLARKPRTDQFPRQ